jgi:hypothetical protein
MHLAMTGLYQAKWSNEIHDEWIRNVLANRPDLKCSQLERTRSLMNKYVDDCLVDCYEYLIPSINLPDADDRHVVAAAIHASASIILTYNLKDFPTKLIKPYGIEARHPDAFLLQLINVNPEVVLSAINRLRATLKNPPVSIDRYMAILENQSLPKTVVRLKSLKSFLN